jgi:hypothetical protein
MLVGGVIAVLAVALALVFSLPKPTAEEPPNRDGTGKPILLIVSDADPFSRYYGEILRAEGFSSFGTVDIADLTSGDLDDASVAILPALDVTASQAELIDGWVGGGGSLVAVRPDAELTGTVGVVPSSGVVQDGYLRVDDSAPPGQGVTPETIQFHGEADRYALREGTRAVATLFADATTPTPYPAVALRDGIGEGGRAVTFAYDLARSIVLTRQGNPAWAGQERDGLPPIRPNELFQGVEEPDFVDMSKVAIPQADEQQRLLANVLLELAGDDDLQVRSWYFPRGAKAVLVMAVDDHSPGDRARSALAFQDEQSEPGCEPADWECIRSSSLMYVNGDLTDAELASYAGKGFDFGLHVDTSCQDWTEESLVQTYSDGLAGFREVYPSQPAQRVNRIHCIAWSDYVTAAKRGVEFGLRLDLNYYYWPDEWVQDRPGFFTGSGIPMRFADLDGTAIDAYQAPTHLVNESGMSYPEAIGALVDRALGPLGYYGAFGTHYDYSDDFDRQLIAVGKARDIPMVSGEQLLTWLDAREDADFGAVTWRGAIAAFDATVPAEARELMTGMIPMDTSRGALVGLEKDGVEVPFAVETIKGVRFGLFTATTGGYEATYAVGTETPVSTAGEG